MNAVSSRSHSVLQIIITQKLKDGSVKQGKLNLADLAGSERLGQTNASVRPISRSRQCWQCMVDACRVTR